MKKSPNPSIHPSIKVRTVDPGWLSISNCLVKTTIDQRVLVRDLLAYLFEVCFQTG
jgi:hypothetical protein